MATYLVDGFLLIQDLFARYSWNIETSQLFQNYFVHVGNNTDWSKNPSCPGAPFMTMAKDGSAQSGYVYDRYADPSYKTTNG